MFGFGMEFLINPFPAQKQFVGLDGGKRRPNKILVNLRQLRLKSPQIGDDALHVLPSQQFRRLQTVKARHQRVLPVNRHGIHHADFPETLRQLFDILRGRRATPLFHFDVVDIDAHIAMPRFLFRLQNGRPAQRETSVCIIVMLS